MSVKTKDLNVDWSYYIGKNDPPIRSTAKQRKDFTRNIRASNWAEDPLMCRCHHRWVGLSQGVPSNLIYCAQCGTWVFGDHLSYPTEHHNETAERLYMRVYNELRSYAAYLLARAKWRGRADWYIDINDFTRHFTRVAKATIQYFDRYEKDSIAENYYDNHVVTKEEALEDKQLTDNDVDSLADLLMDHISRFSPSLARLDEEKMKKRIKEQEKKHREQVYWEEREYRRQEQEDYEEFCRQQYGDYSCDD